MKRFHIRTWGCQMNYADSEKIRVIFESFGLKMTDVIGDADCIVLNTCSVRQRAEDKVLGLAGKIQSLKKQNPDVCVILTGCMAQRVRRGVCDESGDIRYVAGVKRRMPWVDEIIEIGDFKRFRDIVDVGTTDGVDAGAAAGVQQDYLSSPQSSFSRIRANVPISKGCDNFCTYCVVPFARGKEVSREYQDIHKQVMTLVHDGFRLITLLGQNVNSWDGFDNGAALAFPDLLKRVDRIDGDFWLTFLTSHPKDFTAELVEAFAQGQHICRFMNLPAQSGSDSVLKRMNRGYSRDEYIMKAEMLRKKCPDVRLCTDIIVGFPEETDADFDETVDFIKTMKFGMIYLAEYSPRPGTAASLIPETVSADEKTRRRIIVEGVQRSIMEENLAQREGGVEVVLVTSNGRGIAKDLTEVILDSKLDTKIESTVDTVPISNVGTFVNVRITGSSAGGLKGMVTV